MHPPLPFPVPSYASPAFYEAVGLWFDAVCSIIARHLAPIGCIVAVQSDNESCYLFHDQAYATDYSPDSIAAYRRFLSERYGTIAQLNDIYGQHFPDFDAVEPPRDCEISTASDVPRHRDWVEYKERYIHQSVAQIAQMLRSRGVVGVPIFHDVAWQYSTPLDIARMEADPAIDWVGINLYRSPQQYAGVTQRMRYLAGTTRLPFVPEFGCGIWSHHSQTPTPAEEEFVTLAALMHGMRAVNFYMLVERERWQGSPITRHGTFRPEYADLYRRLSTFLQRYPLGTFSRRPPVVVLLNYALGRYAAMASTLHYAHVDLLRLPEALGVVDLDLDFRWDVTRESNHHRSDNWLGSVFAQLKQQQIDYDISDSHIDPYRLHRYPIAYMPTVDFMDAADQQRLLDYVAAGGRLVVGPGMPYLDSNLQPCAILSKVMQGPGELAYGSGQITWVTSDMPAVDPAWRPLSPAIRWDDSEVEIVEQVGEQQRLLFIANPTQRDRKVTVMFDASRSLLPIWGQVGKAFCDTQLTVDLAPYTIQIWEAQYD